MRRLAGSSKKRKTVAETATTTAAYRRPEAIDGSGPSHAALIALAGASFGWMRQATVSSRAAAIMHASYNALFFFVLFAQRRELPQMW